MTDDRHDRHDRRHRHLQHPRPRARRPDRDPGPPPLSSCATPPRASLDQQGGDAQHGQRPHPVRPEHPRCRRPGSRWAGFIERGAEAFGDEAAAWNDPDADLDPESRWRLAEGRPLPTPSRTTPTSRPGPSSRSARFPRSTTSTALPWRHGSSRMRAGRTAGVLSAHPRRDRADAGLRHHPRVPRRPAHHGLTPHAARRALVDCKHRRRGEPDESVVASPSSCWCGPSATSSPRRPVAASSLSAPRSSS